MSGEVCDCEQLDAIELNDITLLLSAWSSFVNHRQEFEDKLALYYYDISKEGKLSKKEVSDYLKDLNDGNHLTSEELDTIFSQADVLGDLGDLSLKP